MHMFCSNCGKETNENMISCAGCGYTPKGLQPQQTTYQQPQQQPYPPYIQKQKYNGMAIAGFVISIVNIFCAGLLFIFGLIFSIIGLVQTNKSGELGKGFAIAGVIISVVYTLLLVLLIVFAVIMYETWPYYIY